MFVKSKKILCVMVVMLMMASMMTAFSADENLEMRANVSKASVTRGNTVKIDVVLDNTDGELFNLANATFEFSFDTSAFTVSDVECDPKGELRELELDWSNDDDDYLISRGRIIVMGGDVSEEAVVISKNIQYPVTLATVTLAVKSNAPLGTYNFVFNRAAKLTKLVDGNLISINNYKFKDGSVDVVSSGSNSQSSVRTSPSPSPSPSPSVSPSPVPSTPPPTSKPIYEKFTDLKGFEWAYNAIDGLVKLDIISGVTDTTYEPGRSITRAEFSKLIVKTFALSELDETKTFSDIKKTDWFYETVLIAAKAGIVAGYEDGSFKPDANITREEMAAMLVRAFKNAGVDVPAADLTFADADEVSDWAKTYVASLAKMGIVSGRGNNMFAPKENLTRAEAAQVLFVSFGQVLLKR